VALVTVLSDRETLAAAAAERVTVLTGDAVASRGRTNLCLSGGHTPRRLYELLADPSRPWRARNAWAQVHVCWGDERPVPPDHAESNFGMAYRALLAHVPIPSNQVHRIRGELIDLREAAREYDAIVRAHEPFDILLLGLGEDAHIASIFPGSPLVRAANPERFALDDPRVTAAWVKPADTWRITLTPPALLEARTILVLVSGAEKASAVYAALNGPADVAQWPAQLLRAAGARVEWFTDAAAAQRLGAPPG
jgi:6-phosphogluconolactonase